MEYQLVKTIKRTTSHLVFKELELNSRNQNTRDVIHLFTFCLAEIVF
jgi:hypothetical protein